MLGTCSNFAAERVPSTKKLYPINLFFIFIVESIQQISTWWLTNPTVHNSKLSSSLWIDKVFRHTCTVVFCRLMVCLIYGGLKRKNQRESASGMRRKGGRNEATPSIFLEFCYIPQNFSCFLLFTPNRHFLLGSPRGSPWREPTDFGQN